MGDEKRQGAGALSGEPTADTLGDIAPPKPGRADLFRAGDVIGGHFEIRGVLGAGGMGQVFEAHDRALNRRVAIKGAWQGHGAALRSEAQALAAIRHPALITVFHVGAQDGVDYVVMERIYGVSLDRHLRRRLRAGSPYTIVEATEIAASIAEGLAAVHRAGVAHRDVKPENVMLAPGNRVVLMDFGLSRAEITTHDGSISGTPQYMAPETITRTVARGGAFLVDTYALGCIVHELVTGEMLFQDETVAKVLDNQLNVPAPSLADLRRDVPPNLATLVAQMLAKDPNERPPSMEVVAWQLRDVARRAASTAGHAFTVLVVDDDDRIARLLTHWVKKAAPDAVVRTANDAEAALARFHERPPDVLLLDLHMPRMNGIEVCMYLRGTSLADRCEIVSVSAGAQPHDVQLLQQLGITELVVKDENLSKRVQELVTRMHARWRAG